MNVEDRLRDALHAKAEATPVSAAGFQPEASPPATRTRWAPGIGAIAAALLLVVVAAVVHVDQDSDTRVSADGPTGRTGATIGSGSGPVLDDDIVFLYTIGTEAHAVLRSGREALLSGVGSSPHLAPDGRTLLYIRGEWPDQETMLLDTRTGEQRSVGSLGQGGSSPLTAEFSRSNRVAVAVVDTNGSKPVRIEIRSTPGFDLERTVELGPSSSGKHFVSQAWNADDRGLLVFTWDTEESSSWWWVDAERGTATPIRVPEELNPTQHASFFLGRAGSAGLFPVLVGGGWGELRVDGGGAAGFTRTAAPGPRLEGEVRVDRFWDVGTLQIRRADDGRFVIDDEGLPGGRLVAYWETYRDESAQLLYVAADGRANVLLEDVGWIDVAYP